MEEARLGNGFYQLAIEKKADVYLFEYVMDHYFKS